MPRGECHPPGVDSPRGPRGAAPTAQTSLAMNVTRKRKRTCPRLAVQIWSWAAVRGAALDDSKLSHGRGRRSRRRHLPPAQRSPLAALSTRCRPLLLCNPPTQTSHTGPIIRADDRTGNRRAEPRDEGRSARCGGASLGARDTCRPWTTPLRHPDATPLPIDSNHQRSHGARSRLPDSRRPVPDPRRSLDVPLPDSYSVARRRRSSSAVIGRAHSRRRIRVKSVCIPLPAPWPLPRNLPRDENARSLPNCLRGRVSCGRRGGCYRGVAGIAAGSMRSSVRHRQCDRGHRDVIIIWRFWGTRSLSEAAERRAQNCGRELLPLAPYVAMSPSGRSSPDTNRDNLSASD